MGAVPLASGALPQPPRSEDASTGAAALPASTHQGLGAPGMVVPRGSGGAGAGGGCQGHPTWEPAPSCEPQRSLMATAAWWKESSGKGTTARSCPGLILQVFHPNECCALTIWYLPHRGGIFLKPLGAKSEGETRQLQVVLAAPPNVQGCWKQAGAPQKRAHSQAEPDPSCPCPPSAGLQQRSRCQRHGQVELLQNHQAHTRKRQHRCEETQQHGCR